GLQNIEILALQYGAQDAADDVIIVRNDDIPRSRRARHASLFRSSLSATCWPPLIAARLIRGNKSRRNLSIRQPPEARDMRCRGNRPCVRLIRQRPELDSGVIR